MKQLFLIFLGLSMFLFAHSQNSQFPVNPDGAIEFTGSINTDLDVKQFFEEAKLWATGNRHIVVYENTESGTITLKCLVKGKTSYNPFAGQFTESYDCVLKLTHKGENVDYSISDIYIINNYMGYGMSTTTTKVEEKVAELEKTKADKSAAESNTELSKKKRKDIIEDCDDAIATLTESLAVTKKFADDIIESLKVKFE
ncbi:MAG: hypothetical protein KBB11_08505 [Bacteroidales bacterium]|nr:hypothetical protein [Bacteroidales bacterium]HOY39221.1 hypothetical protein [Bacteroidales bacterium]HQP04979.1 hypothetical protein [Bacteroidales bacterium]